MDIGSFLLTNVFNGLIALALLLAGYFAFDRLTPSWDFTEVFREKGISGGAIIVAAFLLGLAIVIAAAAV